MLVTLLVHSVLHVKAVDNATANAGLSRGW